MAVFLGWPRQAASDLRLFAYAIMRGDAVSSTARWNFECSFMPTPRTSTTRVQFGVNVDANLSMVEVSTLSPIGTALPAPKHPLLVR